MPTLSESLQGRDLGDLLIIAELWGIELDAPDVRTGLARLVPAMLDQNLVEEVVNALSDDSLTVLEELVRRSRQPWAGFIRRYGELREMGPARRDRERPHLQPISPVEALWYRGLIERAFFDTPAGAEEFAYIPDDLLALLPLETNPSTGGLGRPAYPAEYAHPIPATDRLLDHACTLLAALRMGMTPLPAFETKLGSIGLPGHHRSSGLFRTANSRRSPSVPGSSARRSFGAGSSSLVNF
jgi:hypothetical protein